MTTPAMAHVFTSYGIIAIFVVLALVFLAIVLVLLTLNKRQYQRVEVRQRENEKVVRRIDAMLVAWAVYGEWPPECKDALLAALKDDA